MVLRVDFRRLHHLFQVRHYLGDVLPPLHHTVVVFSDHLHKVVHYPFGDLWGSPLKDFAKMSNALTPIAHLCQWQALERRLARQV